MTTDQFDVCGPLPAAGVTVLEASAGTGKTFTIAALVARYVAEGVPVSEILAVTFTRMATGELRDRVRARLVSAEEGLARFLATGETAAADDSVLAALAAGTAEEVALRRERLATALTAFDEATITTTHGFCQLMLTGLGVSGDVSSGATLLEDARDLVEEVVDDLYVRRVLLHDAAPPFTRRAALDVGQRAVANRDARLAPQPGEDEPGLRRRLADGVRAEVSRRLVDSNLLTFDDLLVRLRDALADGRRGEAACQRLRSRYSVVLVDEFQDTDPIQWAVVRAAFSTGTTRLVLIGDPKQAIYAFRGADVFAYLEAARVAGRRFTLGENWRSDADLLAALDAMLDPLRLGHSEIVYRSVVAAPVHQQPGLEGAPSASPLRARIVPQKGAGLPLTRYGDVQKSAAVDWVAGDLAADVVELLEAAPEVVDWGADGHERSRRSLVPGDVAVLVGTNRQTRIVQDALRAAGVPAVVAGTESVLSTVAADDWLCLLEAVEQPASRSRAVAVALTPWLGMSADAAASADETEWEAVHARLHRWGDTLRRRGVAALFRSVLAGEGVPARLLAEREGERRLTDLGHIAQLLHAEASAGQLGPPALRAWLARRIEDAGIAREGAGAEERSRWLDSDADAVQVLTVHRAKGLEFPVVYCPYLWDEFPVQKGNPVTFHDPVDGARTLDVSGGNGSSDYDRHLDLQRAEERGEALRELYVALTRAKHQVVLWWVRVQNSQHSALGRLLMSRDAEGNVETSARRAPSDDEIREHLLEVGRRVPAADLVSVESATGPDSSGRQWSGRAGGAVGPLDVAAFDRSLDLRWRRTSYSGITALVHGGPEVGSEPEESGTSDEPAVGSAAEAAPSAAPPPVPSGTSEGSGEQSPADAGVVEEQRLRAVVSPWAELPGGTDMGTFVHRILEEVDFAAPSLDDELEHHITELRGRYLAGLSSSEELSAALRSALTTPLGTLAGGISLSDLSRGERLDEMSFELPIAGGDVLGREDSVSTADIARLFDLHEVAGGPLAGYGDRLADPLLGTDLRGYLNGSLDLVFRVGGSGASGRSAGGGGATAPRFFVADYKTNWVGPFGEVLTAWQYRPTMLDVEMQRMHYPLQAILYSVALHRYLRWRLPGYSPEENLGGVLYLFLRGMSGPDTPLVDGEPCGVFSWRPPAALVSDLSDLLEAGS